MLTNILFFRSRHQLAYGRYRKRIYSDYRTNIFAICTATCIHTSEMPTLNVCVQIYMNKKKHTKFIKSTKLLKRREIFILFINFVCFFYSLDKSKTNNYLFLIYTLLNLSFSNGSVSYNLDRLNTLSSSLLIQLNNFLLL